MGTEWVPFITRNIWTFSLVKRIIKEPSQLLHGGWPRYRLMIYLIYLMCFYWWWWVRERENKCCFRGCTSKFHCAVFCVYSKCAMTIKVTLILNMRYYLQESVIEQSNIRATTQTFFYSIVCCSVKQTCLPKQEVNQTHFLFCLFFVLLSCFYLCIIHPWLLLVIVFFYLVICRLVLCIFAHVLYDQHSSERVQCCYSHIPNM